MTRPSHELARMLTRARADIALIGLRDPAGEDAEMVALSKSALAVFDAQAKRPSGEWARDIAASLARTP